jgi:PAS domain S-box-containing protein
MQIEIRIGNFNSNVGQGGSAMEKDDNIKQKPPDKGEQPDGFQSGQAAVEKDGDLFRTLAETTSSGIFLAAERFLYVNPATERLTGYSSEELLSMKFYELVHPEDRERVKSRGLARLRGESPPKAYSFRIITKDGTVRWLDFTADRIIYRGQPVILGTAYDITELKRTKNELRVINELISKVQLRLEKDRLIETVLSELKSLLSPDVALFYLYEEGRLALKARAGVSSGFPDETGIDSCLCGLAARERIVVSSEDINSDLRCTLESCKMQGVVSFVALPLSGTEGLIGLIGLAWKRKQTFEGLVKFFEAISGGLSLFLQNALLFSRTKEYAKELELRVKERTEELQRVVNLMAGRELRMAELKDVITQLRSQLIEAGITPLVDDPLREDYAGH